MTNGNISDNKQVVPPIFDILSGLAFLHGAECGPGLARDVGEALFAETKSGARSLVAEQRRDKMDDKRTLAQVIFSKENAINHDYFAERMLSADSIDEIREALFVLKLHAEPAFVAFIIELVFSNLVTPELDILLDGWRQTLGNELFAKRCREEIGAMALEVFFDAVFERDREGFWQYVPRNDEWTSLPRSMGGEKFALYPQTLCVYLKYLATCSEATKTEHKSKIRKFLRFVLDEPLFVTVPSTSASRFGTSESSDKTRMVGISGWTEDARKDLAKALIANGMYEECIDNNLEEAYAPLALKFIEGWEEINGLILMTPSGKNIISYQDAFEKSYLDKESGHLMGVLIRMALKHGFARFTLAVDEDQRLSSMMRSPSGGSMPAIMWHFSIEPADHSRY